jgi:ABC-type cobalamin transport system ATPase subunit
MLIIFDLDDTVLYRGTMSNRMYNTLKRCQNAGHKLVFNTARSLPYVNEIFDIIKSLHESGITILLVEQNAKAALSIADRAYVLETGKVVLEGDAKELLNNEDVKKAYLGA